MLIPDLAWAGSGRAQRGGPDDVLLDVTAGKVALLIRGRNAWHSTWVQHYLRNTTLFTDVPSATLGAEMQRERGNVFYVIEAPAIELTAVYSRLVLCDAHPDNPFGAFTGLTPKITSSRYGTYASGLYPGVPIRDALEAFGHRSGFWDGAQPSEHSLRVGSLPGSGRIAGLDGSLASFKSVAQGSGYRLGWSEQTTRYSQAGAEGLATGWADRVAAALRQVVDGGRDTAERLVAYRDSVLEAIPESRWREVRDRARRELVAENRRSTAAWLAAANRVYPAEDALERAEEKRRAAGEARLKPATTSGKVRAQRERYERACELVAKRNDELAVARLEAEKARAAMDATRKALLEP